MYAALDHPVSAFPDSILPPWGLPSDCNNLLKSIPPLFLLPAALKHSGSLCFTPPVVLIYLHLMPISALLHTPLIIASFGPRGLY